MPAIARYFGGSAAFWAKLQARDDLEAATAALGRCFIEREVKPLASRPGLA